MVTEDKRKISLFLYAMLVLTILLLTLVHVYFSFSKTNIDTFKSSNTFITLNGPWKFKEGDNLQWANSNFNDSEWENVDLTAPPGAHDDDVGLSGFVPGWTTKGHPNYSGYAWYRLNVLLDSVKGNEVALGAPAAVDDAYQLFINGSLFGNAGDFSSALPVVYSIQPQMYLLPDSLRKEKQITIAFRVWMSAGTLGQGPDKGGIHIAPVLGEKNKVELKYKAQWSQTIKGYVVEVVEPVTFLLLAISMSVFYRGKRLLKQCKWFILALLFLGMIRLNQALYFWWQIESSHASAILTTFLLRPLILGCWLMAWREWFELDKPKWLPIVILIVTLIYMASGLFGLSWISSSNTYIPYQAIANYSRYIFIGLLLFIVIKGTIRKDSREILTILAITLLSIGIFAREYSLLNIIPGIWFPYGVGVSRSQYAYAAFVIVIYLILIKRNKQLIEIR
jgi:hypothetical protein